MDEGGADHMGTMSPQWSAALAGWALSLRAAGRPASTIGLRLAHLRRFAAREGAQEPWDTTGEELLAWVGSHDWRPETRRSIRSSLRSFYTWGVERGHMTSSPALILPGVRPSPPHPHPAAESALEVALLIASPRERLMVRLAAECGLRRGEVAQIHARDLIAEPGGWSLIVHGKGAKVRTVPLTDSLALELHACGSGWAFPGCDDGHLSPAWVGKVVGRLLPDGTSMHALRHRFATCAYAVNRDLLCVQDLLGHASADTTRRYVQVPREAARELVEAVSCPG